MISPQLHPDSTTSRPPAAPAEPFNVSLEHRLPALDEPRLVIVTGADMESHATTDAVVTGLWHCLLGSLVAGLGVSAVLGMLVLVLNLIS
jgi:hypothetical protein